MKATFQFFALWIALFSLPVTADDTMSDDSGFLEGYNRAMFAVNDKLDSYLFKPVAKGYQVLTPDFVEFGVVNFFSNLGEIGNVINDLLQGKGGQAVNDSGRFLVNTTLGIAGLFDVAGKIGMRKNEGGEDFGQTLGKWGVGDGGYLVLPFLGPSSLRDAPARFVDSFTNPVRYIDHVPTRNTIYGVGAVNSRAELLDAEKVFAGDKYQLIKDAYLQRREFLVNDGQVEDDFGSYDDY